ncbi:uncharacterized protein EI97DRAFT_60601 [Westerdykella ornata]|uniref:Uncharacterized protein n=1 Tax=Westerdykella ornata TaxID=318751 RepID=A0A6A6JI59_WESOR|nr:uncharacterized protein EI97DRAFT_60601 [Westerdykella ornata]KAF2275915.1 hypothetical protein EI97DRAFT_60601 [Westerdykella ornata]
MATWASSLLAIRPAASQAIVDATTATLPAESVRRVILLVCNELLNMEAKTTLWNAPIPKPFTISLSTLYDRLLDGKLPPSPTKVLSPGLESQASSQTLTWTQNTQTLSSMPNRTTSLTPEDRPLQDFEDVYYALLAKLQDLHEMLSVRVANGFTLPATPIFPSGPTVVETCAQLQYFWHVLNDPCLAKALDEAVRRARVDSLHEEIVQKLMREQITEGDAGQLIEDLYTSLNAAKEGEERMPGLAWVGGWAPSMITAWLEEKYRSLLRREKEAWEWEQREKRRELRQQRKKERMVKEAENREREREQAWRERYGDPTPEWEAALMKKAFVREADSVQEIGRTLRRSAGGKGSCDESE